MASTETHFCMVNSKTEFLWKINLTEENTDYRSPVFYYDPVGHKWSLGLYLHYKHNDNENLLYLSAEKLPLVAKVQVSIKIKNSQMKVLASMANVLEFYKPIIKAWPAEIILRRIDIKDFEKKVLPDKYLLIYCEIGYGCDDTSLNINMKNKLSRIFNYAKFSDFKLQNGKHLFPVHKCVLAASSPVFEAMMEESQKNILALDGTVGNNVIQEMIIFMYTGEAPNVDQLANELIGVADKYDVQDLKRICADALMSQVLTVQNAAETLILSDLYRVDYLKQQSIKFIIDHSDVLTTNEWKSLTENHTKLLDEIFRCLMIAYENKKLSAAKNTLLGI